MIRRINGIAAGAFVIFEVIIIISAVDGILSEQGKIISLSLLATACLISPFIIAWIAERKNVMMPPHFQFAAVTFVFLTQYFGEMKGFYTRYWWWDLLLHALFGSYAVITALYLVKGILKKEQNTSHKRFTFFTSVFAFCFAVSLGTLWEVFEFLGDTFLKTNMLKGGLEDTATDLIVKILASFTTSSISYFRRN